MKVMVDTNIIISTLLSPHGQAAKAFYKAVQPPFEPLVCQYIIDEVHRKFAEKLAAHASKLRGFGGILPFVPHRTDARNVNRQRSAYLGCQGCAYLACCRCR